MDTVSRKALDKESVLKRISGRGFYGLKDEIEAGEHDVTESEGAAALGRTHGTVLTKAYALKKSGQFNHYASLGKIRER